MKEIDWANLSFGYMRTDYNVRINFRNGKWGEPEVSSEEYLNLHMAATCLHYGQEAFEGLKAFRGKDGKVRIFRLEENAARLQSTCQGILMAELPTERFKEAILKVVKLNERFIPPYETGASLYIRPLLIGTSAQVGVHPADEYMFVVFVTPVGPYFKGGFSTNPYVIIREFDRAAPHGTGIYKVGGNYAASLRANKKAHDLGYSCEFYLDAKEKKYIDECGAANFFGIKDNTYITPKSTSILPSITNKSLMQLAEDMGIKVERRPIPEEELATFEEAGACGTAAVISPIERIDDLENGKSYVISIAQTGDNADYNQAYTWLKEIVDEKGADTEALGLSLFSFSSMKKMLNDPNFKEQYIQDYLKVSAGLDAQLKAAQAANNQKEVNALTAYKSGVDNAFANSGAADCETLQNLYAAKIEENKDNLPYLKETISLLRRTGCQEIEAYFLASDYAYRQEPSAEAAVGLGKKAVKIKDYDTAIKYFDEAANLETDATSKADDYYMIALLLFEQNAYSKARQYCQKALEVNPNYGNAYLLIGKMYAATSKSVFPNDGVLARAAYNAAIDKFEKAKQVDPSVAEEANTLISSYRAHLPSTEEIFMHPDLEKGKPFTVGGWIGERTTIR